VPELYERDGADAVEKVLAEFDGRVGQFEDLRDRTKDLIERILEEEHLRIHSVQGRVKNRDKLKAKYLNPEKDYKCLSDMPDVVGLRVITYYSDEIDIVAEVIRREFDRNSPDDDKRQNEPGHFGYSALHLDCSYLAIRLQQTEYRRFAQTRFEVQVTTILGHAWSEMHHGWYDDRNSSPPDEERIFHRLAAVLELADKEFLAVKHERTQREQVASVRVASKAPATKISSESLTEFIDKTPEVTALEEEFAKLFGRELRPAIKSAEAERLARVVRAAGIETVEGLEKSLSANESALREYLVRCAPMLAALQRSEPPRKLSRGLSVYHLCLFLFGSKGKDSLLALIQRAGRSLAPSLDVDEQVRIAEEVAAKHGLT